MIQVSQLNREERIKKIIVQVIKKTTQSMIFLPFQSIEPHILTKIVESIEHRIYFISEYPLFDFKGKSYECSTYKCKTIEDFKNLINKDKKQFFILYNIMLSNDTNIPQNQFYIIRGVFINDISIERDEIINKLLNE